MSRTNFHRSAEGGNDSKKEDPTLFTQVSLQTQIISILNSVGKCIFLVLIVKKMKDDI